MSMYHVVVGGLWFYGVVAVYLVYLASTRMVDRDPPDTDS